MMVDLSWDVTMVEAELKSGSLMKQSTALSLLSCASSSRSGRPQYIKSESKACFVCNIDWGKYLPTQPRR